MKVAPALDTLLASTRAFCEAYAELVAYSVGFNVHPKSYLIP